MRSPGRAVERRMDFPFGAEPITGCPPSLLAATARCRRRREARSSGLASASSPSKKPSTQRWGSRGQAAPVIRKHSERFAAHGGDVAQSAYQAAVSDGARRLPLPAEVHILKQKSVVTRNSLARAAASERRNRHQFRALASLGLRIGRRACGCARSKLVLSIGMKEV